MKVTTKGQVTIPQEIREYLGIRPGVEVEFKIEGDVVQIIPVRGSKTRGHALISRMRGRATVRMTTDEIMNLTGESVMPGTLVDSNVLLDVLTEDPRWFEWSSTELERCANEGELYINAVIYAEVSTGFEKIEEVEAAISEEVFTRLPVPLEAAFLAGKAFVAFRKRGGTKSSTLPDFFIGAHAVVLGLRLLTRDSKRYRTYFPDLEIISPSSDAMECEGVKSGDA